MSERMRAEREDVKVGRAYGVAFAVTGALFALALALGSTRGAGVEIVAELRLPRALLAAATGAGLGVAGAVLQAVFTNPLCEPYVLGISSVASLAAVLGQVLGAPLVFLGLSAPALAGALGGSGFLYGVSIRRGATGTTLLLCGVMLGFLSGSLVAVIMAVADPNGIMGALFWLLGDLSRARLPSALLALGLVAGLSALVLCRWRALDALLMGEESAEALGIDVRAARRSLIALSSLLVAVCVSGSGMIGFVGLVAPHVARRGVGPLHRRLLPLCALWGASGLLAADTLGRVLARPYELPAGSMSALLGAPFFLWILLRRGERAS